MQRNRQLAEKSTAAVIVVTLHGLLGYLLIAGLGRTAVDSLGDPLKVFDVQDPVPPAARAIPARTRARKVPSPVSPAGHEAARTPSAAPLPVPRLFQPVALPEPTSAPDGLGPAEGASTATGVEAGADADGIGLGGGGQGDGTGVGGKRRAERVGGSLLNSDYPRSALRMGIEGSVKVRFTVAEDGYATRCLIMETSGFAALDQITCRLIERRFRYRPALDASGRPVAQEEVKVFDWWLPKRRDKTSPPPREKGPQ